jgi:hypothetical protein
MDVTMTFVSMTMTFVTVRMSSVSFLAVLAGGCFLSVSVSGARFSVVAVTVRWADETGCRENDQGENAGGCD